MWCDVAWVYPGRQSNAAVLPRGCLLPRLDVAVLFFFECYATGGLVSNSGEFQWWKFQKRAVEVSVIPRNFIFCWESYFAFLSGRAVALFRRYVCLFVVQEAKPYLVSQCPDTRLHSQQQQQQMRVMTVDEDTGLLLLPRTYVTRHGQTPSNSHRLIVRSGVLPGQILCGGASPSLHFFSFLPLAFPSPFPSSPNLLAFVRFPPIRSRPIKYS